jgi:hypothetical protein
MSKSSLDVNQVNLDGELCGCGSSRPPSWMCIIQMLYFSGSAYFTSAITVKAGTLESLHLLIIYFGLGHSELTTVIPRSCISSHRCEI